MTKNSYFVGCKIPILRCIILCIKKNNADSYNCKALLIVRHIPISEIFKMLGKINHRINEK